MMQNSSDPFEGVLIDNENGMEFALYTQDNY